MRTVRLAVDARRTSASGIGRYTFCLLEALSALAASSRFEVWALGQQIEGLDRVSWIPFDEPLLYPWQRSSLPNILRFINADIMIAPQYYVPSDLSIPVIRVLHDAHPFWPDYDSPSATVFENIYGASNLTEMARRVSCVWNPTPEAGDRSASDLIQSMYRYVSEAGEKIVTVSDFSARDLRSCLQRPRNIDFSYPYIPTALRSALAKNVGQNRINSTILMVAKVEPRKRHIELIDAVDKIRQNMDVELDLVLIGGDTASFPEYASQLHNTAAKHTWVQDLGQISDARLAECLHQAGLVVFPSVSEGFGFPALEALATGAPLLAAAGSSLPEVCGDAAYLFDEHALPLKTAVEDALQRVEFDSSEDVLLRRQHADSFTLSSFAKGWLGFIEEVL